ncbi:Glucose-specific phosphotransferase enzyme IIA component [uncultured Clostridium sp.]|uniref:PTS glucose transporter subunit IIA n=1 Tax=Paeniclostridium hominis TaxID=2764329 RepID=A0ABR7K182_9FIRM|nr:MULTISPECIES: PTS glucose transporter subunit IIA [Paeniclostridium]MDU1538437.1 PTS glucose transporter subunit IIA [Paeniclostridium sordellii]SCI90255.1 Glucose-specific phosphotransferase enzyme IIA component [uncultured Clostridium sp.]MBC6002838.1 PTS glucose transporter subunit IIA [Paeniclostridium hominis]MBC8630327.1 PTS glucose transporter subunit IIA [[Eubacterium] tenue]SCJ02641.1 Glucose-specific phosphotransferase enzyme IIA component [uncultured Clostridium sp.]
MGIFDIFKKSKQEESKGIVSPTNGELLEITKVPDEVFSTKMMGDGFAIKSTDGIIVSPVDGKVGVIFETKHAVIIESKEGKEVLIHLGIDTVNLKGEGFEVFVNVGDEVKAGDKLVKMDLPFIEANAKSSISPVIFTNLESNESIKVVEGPVKAFESGRVEIVK